MGLNSFFKNLFGTAKETVVDLADQAESTFEQAKEAAAPYIDKAETFADETISKVKEASEPIIANAADYAHQAKDIVSEYADKASDALDNVVESVKEKQTNLPTILKQLHQKPLPMQAKPVLQK
ncbi:YtxH domain-containing protein [Flavobacterium sp. YO12]|uniref:YtxH domain-containing protein n=1 Tax=Flavobacterium sp. YO12 TaxID=1920029 RepID=UPI001F510479|nr:YtxH domain-containing protein [Flavobacterium sp. YO12]